MPFLHLDITEVHICVAGNDTQGHQDVILLYILESFPNGVGKQAHVPDHKVPRRSHQNGFRVPCKQRIGGVGHTGSRFAGVGFHQQVLRRKHRQFAPGLIGKTLRGDHQDVVFRNHFLEAVISDSELAGRAGAVGHNHTETMGHTHMIRHTWVSRLAGNSARRFPCRRRARKQYRNTLLSRPGDFY